MTIYCANPACGKEIPDDVLKARHYSSGTMHGTICCNIECERARRRAVGLYKQMSVAGKEARSEAVTKSNQHNPRRKRRVIDACSATLLSCFHLIVLRETGRNTNLPRAKTTRHQAALVVLFFISLKKGKFFRVDPQICTLFFQQIGKTCQFD